MTTPIAHSPTETTTAAQPATAPNSRSMRVVDQAHRHHAEHDARPRREAVLQDVTPQFDAFAEVHQIGHQVRRIRQERQPAQAQRQ